MQSYAVIMLQLPTITKANVENRRDGPPWAALPRIGFKDGPWLISTSQGRIHLSIKTSAPKTSKDKGPAKIKAQTRGSNGSNGSNVSDIHNTSWLRIVAQGLKDLKGVERGWIWQSLSLQPCLRLGKSLKSDLKMGRCKPARRITFTSNTAQLLNQLGPSLEHLDDTWPNGIWVLPCRTA